MWFIYTMEYYLTITKDESSEYHAMENKSNGEGQPSDFTHNMEYKPESNKLTPQTHRHGKQGCCQKGRWGRMKRVKEVKYMAMEGDQTLGDVHPVQCVDDTL